MEAPGEGPKPKGSWAERTIGRLDEPKVLAVLIVAIALVVGVTSVYALYAFNRFLQNPFPDMGVAFFRVTGNSSEWKATFEDAENSSWLPRDHTTLTNVYITVFKPDGALGLATKRVSEMASGQSYGGIQFFDLGDIWHLDNGDYFTFDKSIFPHGGQVTVEGHGSGWSWSMGFGLQTWL